MPSKGYSTIGLKPAVLARLEKATDEYYPGMFLPSALIIVMNEIKRKHYSMEMHTLRVDFSGKYSSLTMRSDVKQWLEENYKNLNEEYTQKYNSRNFTQFASFFMINMFESKADSSNYLVKLKESDFNWLATEYTKRKLEYRTKYGIYTFERFADVFLRELFEKLNAAKKILNS